MSVFTWLRRRHRISADAGRYTEQHYLRAEVRSRPESVLTQEQEGVRITAKDKSSYPSGRRGRG